VNGEKALAEWDMPSFWLDHDSAFSRTILFVL